MNSWFETISSLLLPVLELIQRYTHDWGLAVIVLTLLVKTVLYLPQLQAARQQVRMTHVQPELQHLRELHKDDPQQLATATMKLYEEKGIRPFRSIRNVLLQMPIWMGLYGLFLVHGAAMTSVLLPWIGNLSMSDPLHVLPLLTALGTGLTVLIPLTADSAAASPTAVWTGRTVMLALAVLLPLAFMWRAPAALGLYWLTSSAFSLMERLFYRTGWGKRLLARA
ncbi:YidC/Oxa1 family membrane protein insertase [Paenibacillus chartarius]|uniref:YidC/Oxa1 family membrane protein insertase n=1 Tax=Paenibacillus chartarius TaxID=747481 RepID=A0ABV6DKA1_9BACL